MNAFINLIHKRKSIRSFLDKPLEEGEIKEIVESGRVAPSAMNAQTSHFVAISNKEVLKKLKMEVQGAYLRFDLAKYPEYEGWVNRFKRSGFDFTYNPVAFIIATNLKDSLFGERDTSCSLENMMLASTSLNIGSVWINQLDSIQNDEIFRKFLKEELNIYENEKIIGCLS